MDGTDMVRNNTFARGAVLGALVTTSIAMFGFLGAQNEAITRRDQMLREYISESAQQRDALEAQVANLERALGPLDAVAEFGRAPETGLDVDLRAESAQQRDALEARVANLERALGRLDAVAEFDRASETGLDVDLRAQQAQLAALAQTVARHNDELLILMSERHTNQNNR